MNTTLIIMSVFIVINIAVTVFLTTRLLSIQKVAQGINVFDSGQIVIKPKIDMRYEHIVDSLTRDPNSWVMNKHTLDHESGLQLWIANGFKSLKIYRPYEDDDMSNVELRYLDQAVQKWIEWRVRIDLSTPSSFATNKEFSKLEISHIEQYMKKSSRDIDLS